MAGGTHTWALAVTLGGVDVTARLRGRQWRRQAESAAHLAEVRLALGAADPDDEADAAEGAVLVIAGRWDGGAWSTRFSGWVQSADYDDSEGVLILSASDRLQELAEAASEAAVDALVPGTQRRAEVQRARTDGWQQLQEALKTVQGSVAIGRDGVFRLVPWDPTAADVVLTPGHYRAQGVSRVRRPVRERVNRVSYAISIRGPRLSQWIVHGHWGYAQTYAEYAASPWERPPVQMIQQAVTAAGPVYHRSGQIGTGIGDGGGLSYVLPPETDNGYITVGGVETPYWQDPTVCTSAAWDWDLRSRQLVDLVVSIQVDCLSSQARYGVLVDERHATLDHSQDHQGWESSTAARPSADEWAACAGGSAWLGIPRAEEVAVVESALAEAVATIRGSHRQTARVQALPWRVQTLDLHHAVRMEGGTLLRRVAGIEESWDVATWEVDCILTLRHVQDLGDSAATVDALTAPERLPVPVSYSVATDVSYPTHMGGEVGAPVYDGTWMGVSTNRKAKAPGAEVYPLRARVERPAVPTGARATTTVQTETPTIYRVRLAATT